MMKKIIIIWLSVLFLNGIAIYPGCQTRAGIFASDTIVKKNYIKPVYHILGYSLLINRFDYYVKKVPWSDVNPSTWWLNINRGFMTDGDAFFTNWFGHPFHGSIAYNAARMHDLGFYESTPYVIGQTLLWEYFAETEPPSIIDLYTTTLGGIYLGEITYRLTDYAWNHPSKYKNLRFRNIIGGLINPVAALNRCAFGKNLSVTSQSLTPLELSVDAGLMHRFDLSSESKSITGQRIGIDLNYGNYLDMDKIKYNAFDHFRVNSWLIYVNHYKTSEKKIYFNFRSDATIFGKKMVNQPQTAIFASLGQRFDYIHNDRYKLSTIALTGDGSIAKTFESVRVAMAAKIGLIIYGSSNSEDVKPVHPEIFDKFNRDYLYGQGFMMEAETNIDLKNKGILDLTFNHYRIISKENPEGVKNAGILKARYNVSVYQNISLGIQYEMYQSNTKLKTPGEHYKAAESYNDLSLLLVFNF